MYHLRPVHVDTNVLHKNLMDFHMLPVIEKKGNQTVFSAQIFVFIIFNPEKRAYSGFVLCYTEEIKIREQSIHSYFFSEIVNLHRSKFEGILAVGVPLFY